MAITRLGPNQDITAAKIAGTINFKNLIINGDMRIDQRNAGAAVTASGSYPVDRFNVNNTSDGSFSAQQSSTVPAGFSKSVGVTITASDSSLTGTQRLVLRQTIEGYNIAHFNWGTSDAKTVTLSFKVRSSVTGTFSGSLRNSAGDRSYPFTYSISSANTWTDISVTIAGETTGSWNITNGEGILVFFSLGVGPDLQGTAGAWASGNYWGASGETQLVNTNGATFYITGVQLEIGTSASDFEFLPYDVNFRRCQRYHFRHNPTKDAHVGVLMGFANGGSDINSCTVPVPVPMRANPSLSTDPASGSIAVRYYTPQQGTGTISSYTTLASQGDCASDGSGYLALTLNGFGGNLHATAPNGIEFESTCLIMDSEL